MWLVQRPLGTLLADHAPGINGGDCGRWRGGKACLRCDDDDEEDRHRRSGGSAARLTAILPLSLASDSNMEIAGWEKLYGTGERGKEDAATTLLVETLATLAPGSAIDLASGAGRNALYMAERGWTVTAIDGSESAIQLLKQRATARSLKVQTTVGDLKAPNFAMPSDAFDLVLIAYYLQRDLFLKAKAAVRPGGLVIAIAHIPVTGEPWTEKRAAPGELKAFFNEWEILWTYEGVSRDPAHKQPVAEIVARRPE